MIGELLLLASLAWQPPAANTAALRLEASALQPFAGEVVTVRLTLTLPKNLTLPQQARVVIPWLSADHAWRQPMEEWLCARSATREGLALRVNDHPMPVRIPRASESASAATYLLEWQFVARTSPYAEGDTINLRPARVRIAEKEIISNSVALRVRPLPVTGRTATGLDLGVGRYVMEARLATSSPTLREGTQMLLQVRGEGALDNVPRPPLRDLAQALSARDFTIEEESETWLDAMTRVWTYRLRPRRADVTQVPAIAYQFFDPRREQYVFAHTKPLPLAIQPLPDTNAQSLPESPDGLATPLPWVSHEPWLARWRRLPDYALLAVLVIPPAWWLGRLLARRIGRRRSNAEGLSLAARHTMAQLARMPRPVHDVELLAALMVTYLQKRFLLATAEPSQSDLATSLQDWQVEPALVRAAQTWWADCLAQRFGKAHNDGEPLVVRAQALIPKLDATRDPDCLPPDSRAL